MTHIRQTQFIKLFMILKMELIFIKNLKLYIYMRY